ncbi:MAG: hypothetical protein F6J93_06365 [Oscillatoria sp. SIO1A7]|nr:hypothetical protein [Oscillatoria sp. SIO1A7]
MLRPRHLSRPLFFFEEERSQQSHFNRHIRYIRYIRYLSAANVSVFFPTKAIAAISFHPYQSAANTTSVTSVTYPLPTFHSLFYFLTSRAIVRNRSNSKLKQTGGEAVRLSTSVLFSNRPAAKRSAYPPLFYFQTDRRRSGPLIHLCFIFKQAGGEAARLSTSVLFSNKPGARRSAYPPLFYFQTSRGRGGPLIHLCFIFKQAGAKRSASSPRPDRRQAGGEADRLVAAPGPSPSRGRSGPPRRRARTVAPANLY